MLPLSSLGFSDIQESPDAFEVGQHIERCGNRATFSRSAFDPVLLDHANSPLPPASLFYGCLKLTDAA